MKFSLEDLNPRPCDIEIEVREAGELKVKRYSLRKFNLMAQIWIRKEWGSEEKFNEAIDPNSKVNVESGRGAFIEAICKTVHYLMEDKSDFQSWEDLASAIGIGPREIMNLERVFLTVLGMSQPLVDKALSESKKKLKGGRK